MKREDKMLMLAVLTGMSGLSLITSLLSKRKKSNKKDEDCRTMIVWGHSDNDEERFLDLYTKFCREQETSVPKVKDTDEVPYRVYLVDEDGEEIEDMYREMVQQRADASKKNLYKAYSEAVEYQKSPFPEMVDERGTVCKLNVVAKEG